MSIPRCAAGSLASTSCATSIIISRLSNPYSSRCCTQGTRQFTSSLRFRLSSKRKIVTTTAYRPETLEPPPPPPQSAGSLPMSHLQPTPAPGTWEAPSTAIPKTKLPSYQLPTQRAPPKPSPALDSNSTSSSSQSPTPSIAKPKRPALKARKAVISLTPSALSHLRNLLEQPEPRIIRIGVKNRGCSGLAYHLEYVDKPGAFDESVEQDGVKVLIDSKALFSIIGSEMDWVEDKLNQRFVFRNPNIKEQCGCGESFMV